MKQKYIYWFFILFGTILPIIFDSIAHDYGRHYPFIWSIFLVPSIFIMILYPSWKVVIRTGIFYSLFELIVELSQGNLFVFSMDMIAFGFGIIVNWSILVTMGYFRLQTEKLLREVEEMTLMDPLTALYNRRYFNLYIEKAIPLSKRMNSSLILVMIDIDHFKRINDTYGHVCGDFALKHIADVIKSNVRDTDALTRMGGEEFGLLMSETSLEEGRTIAERIRKAVEESEFFYQNNKIPITISLGLTEYKSEKVDMFIEKTDRALYKAKANGRNQLCFE